MSSSTLSIILCDDVVAGRIAMEMRQPSRHPPVIVVEPRYIDRAKLTDLLAKLFPPKTYAAEVRRGHWIISTPIPLTKDQLDACAQDTYDE